MRRRTSELSIYDMFPNFSHLIKRSALKGWVTLILLKP